MGAAVKDFYIPKQKFCAVLFQAFWKKNFNNSIMAMQKKRKLKDDQNQIDQMPKIQDQIQNLYQILIVLNSININRSFSRVWPDFLWYYN